MSNIPMRNKTAKITGLCLLFLSPLILYYFYFPGSFTSNHTKWAEFGSYISGVYGALAFLILAVTTVITRQQFKIQNQDNIFFSLHQALENRIATAATLAGESKLTAHQVLKLISEKFYEELSEQSIMIGRLLFTKTPETVADVHFMKLFQATYGNEAIFSFDDIKQEFMSDMTSDSDCNQRWETLKKYIGSNGFESPQVRDALRATGSVNFYKLPFQDRRKYYKVVADNLLSEYGEFLDGYFKTITFLVNYADSAINKDTYIEFIKSQLSKYELVILFYLISGSSENILKFKAFHHNNILDGLLNFGSLSLLIDCPPADVLKRELGDIFQRHRDINVAEVSDEN